MADQTGAGSFGSGRFRGDPKPVCREALSQIYMYLDGELTASARIEIARHLQDCPPCGDLYGFETELKRVIAQRCTDQPPPGLRDRIAGALGLPTSGLPGTGRPPFGSADLPGPPTI